MASINIRRAGEEDAQLISVLNADVQAVHAQAMPDLFRAPDAGAFSLQVAADILAGRDNLVFIAEADGAAAGYAYAAIGHWPDTAFLHGRDVIYLHHISVRPKCRRRGIGTALIAAVKAAGHDFGIDRVTLDVWSFNTAARAFFLRHGFATFAERLWTA